MKWPSAPVVRHLVENDATARPGSRPLGKKMSRWWLKRITFRGNWSFDLLLFVAWLLFCLLVLVPWLVRHPGTQ
jgi:hypothetical protein